MGHMKEIDRVLRDIDGRMESVDRQLGQLLHLMADMVQLEGKLERRFDEIKVLVGRSDKLVDRLLEMSMVQSGHPTEAVQHRAQTRIENQSTEREVWEDDEEDVWPPKGCDSMEMNG